MTQYEFPKSKLVAIFRGVTGACPRCGSHKTHTKYFSIRPNCLKCNLKFEREPGYWTGAMALNLVSTSLVIVVGLVAGLIMTAPEIAVVPIIATLAPIAILMPIIAYPYSQTSWMAVDYAFMSKLDI